MRFAREREMDEMKERKTINDREAVFCNDALVPFTIITTLPQDPHNALSFR